MLKGGNLFNWREKLRHVAQAGLKTPKTSASASQMLELQVWTPVPGLKRTLNNKLQCSELP